MDDYRGYIDRSNGFLHMDYQNVYLCGGRWRPVDPSKPAWTPDEFFKPTIVRKTRVWALLGSIVLVAGVVTLAALHVLALVAAGIFIVVGASLLGTIMMVTAGRMNSGS